MIARESAIVAQINLDVVGDGLAELQRSTNAPPELADLEEPGGEYGAGPGENPLRAAGPVPTVRPLEEVDHAAILALAPPDRRRTQDDPKALTRCATVDRSGDRANASRR